MLRRGEILMRNNLSLDNTFSGLDWISNERKMAIAFALYANITLTEVVKLKWSDTLELDNWRAEFILEKIQLSESIDNVFWERCDGKDVAITLLPCVFGIATMWMEWCSFVSLNQLSIPIEFKKYFIIFFP